MSLRDEPFLSVIIMTKYTKIVSLSPMDVNYFVNNKLTLSSVCVLTDRNIFNKTLKIIN